VINPPWPGIGIGRELRRLLQGAAGSSSGLCDGYPPLLFSMMMMNFKAISAQAKPNVLAGK
jgi:hypothetical protein